MKKVQMEYLEVAVRVVYICAGVCFMLCSMLLGSFGRVKAKFVFESNTEV